jgi:hypothetical protein
VGIDGKYLKLGKRKADAVPAEEEDEVGDWDKEEFVIITLLKGYKANWGQSKRHIIRNWKMRLTSAYGPPRPNNLFNPLTRPPQLLS